MTGRSAIPRSGRYLKYAPFAMRSATESRLLLNRAAGKRLPNPVRAMIDRRLLKTAAPTLSRIALLSTTPGTGGHETQLADAEQAAASLGVSVTPYRVTSLRELEPALAAIVDDGMTGLVSFQGALSLANRHRIVEFAATHRLPAMYQATMFAEAGGLMAWAPDLEEQFRTAASYVDQILKGAKPGDLPIRHPPRYFLTINAGAARNLGLSLPPALIAQAHRVLP